jgi:hypothetical protein
MHALRRQVERAFARAGALLLTRGRSGVLGLSLAVVAVLVPVGDAASARSGGAADRLREVKLSWQIVVEDRSVPAGGAGCSVTAYLQVNAVPGAVSYAVTIVDTQTTTYHLSGPPFPGDKVDVVGQIVRAPAGTHRWGLSSYGATTRGEGCVQARTNFLSGTRWKVTKAVALVPGKPEPEKGTISGVVRERDCSGPGPGCTYTGLPGVTITATGPGGTVRATTKGANGAYSVDVEAGRWTVTPSLANRDFDPPTRPAVVSKGGSAVADFTTCADGPEPQGLGEAMEAALTCKRLEVQVMRIKSGGDSGWVESSGKKLLGNPTVPVGFTQPTHNGDFEWQCRTGCINVRIRVRDAKTKKVVPVARVQLTAELAQRSVTDDAPNGVLCPAREDLAQDCGPTIQNVVLEQKRDLDLYYWLPGVVDQTNVRLYVSVRVPKYPTVSKTLSLTLKPNLAFSRTITLSRYHANQLLWYGSAMKGVALGDFSSYCAQMLASITGAVAPGVTAEERSATLYTEQKAEDALKKLGKTKGTPISKLCGAFDFPRLAAHLTKVAPMKLWTTFRPAFGFPVHGLLGANRYSDRVLQDIFGFSGFYGAFNDGLVAYLYDGVDLTNPSTATNPSAGSRITLKIFEVSHRLPNGKVKDALYLRLTGVKARKKTTPYEAYAVDGYWPSCWLDPKLNDADFTWFENSCKSDEP